jgi:hypothetical protein
VTFAPTNISMALPSYSPTKAQRMTGEGRFRL